MGGWASEKRGGGGSKGIREEGFVSRSGGVEGHRSVQEFGQRERRSHSCCCCCCCSCWAIKHKDSRRCWRRRRGRERESERRVCRLKRETQEMEEYKEGEKGEEGGENEDRGKTRVWE